MVTDPGWLLQLVPQNPAEMDLVSASTEKLEPLPELSSQPLSSPEKEEEKKWLEDITEKAGRGGNIGVYA